jgi:hypothetical protein
MNTPVPICRGLWQGSPRSTANRSNLQVKPSRIMTSDHRSPMTSSALAIEQFMSSKLVRLILLGLSSSCLTHSASPNWDPRQALCYEASRRRRRERFKLIRFPQVCVLHHTRDWFFELS